MCALIKLTSFGNRYAVTFVCYTTEPKAASLHWRTAQRPFVSGIFLDTESRRAEHVVELYRRRATAS